MADLRFALIRQADHLDHIKANTGRFPVQFADITQCGAAQGKAFAAVHGVQRPGARLVAPGFYLHENQGVGIARYQVDLVTRTETNAPAENLQALAAQGLFRFPFTPSSDAVGFGFLVPQEHAGRITRPAWPWLYRLLVAEH